MGFRVENLDSENHTWAGQLIEAEDGYDLAGSEAVRFASDATFITDLAAAKARVLADGTEISDLAVALDRENLILLNEFGRQELAHGLRNLQLLQIHVRNIVVAGQEGGNLLLPDHAQFREFRDNRIARVLLPGLEYEVLFLRQQIVV